MIKNNEDLLILEESMTIEMLRGRLMMACRTDH